jgi:hypothetical protein
MITISWKVKNLQVKMQFTVFFYKLHVKLLSYMKRFQTPGKKFHALGKPSSPKERTYSSSSKYFKILSTCSLFLLAIFPFHIPGFGSIFPIKSGSASMVSSRKIVCPQPAKR